jgi:hypothetical protein
MVGPNPRVFCSDLIYSSAFQVQSHNGYKFIPQGLYMIAHFSEAA